MIKDIDLKTFNIYKYQSKGGNTKNGTIEQTTKTKQQGVLVNLILEINVVVLIVF